MKPDDALEPFASGIRHSVPLGSALDRRRDMVFLRKFLAREGFLSRPCSSRPWPWRLRFPRSPRPNGLPGSPRFTSTTPRSLPVSKGIAPSPTNGR